jgi:hypothetical protein
MELGPAWEAASRSATQEFPKIVWQPKIRWCVHETHRLVPILRQINPVRNKPSFSLNSVLILRHLHLSVPSGLFPLWFHTKTLYPILLSPCVLHALLFLFDLTTPITFVDKYMLWNTPFSSFSLTSYYFSALGSKYSPQQNSSQIPSVYIFLKTKFHTHTKLQAKW